MTIVPIDTTVIKIDGDSVSITLALWCLSTGDAYTIGNLATRFEVDDLNTTAELRSNRKHIVIDQWALLKVKTSVPMGRSSEQQQQQQQRNCIEFNRHSLTLTLSRSLTLTLLLSKDDISQYVQAPVRSLMLVVELQDMLLVVRQR
jgi:hypothetical protein